MEKEVREVAERQWMKECKGISKLRTYIRCKKKLEVSAYLQVEDLEGRRRLARLRSGTNCLRVSTGRWEGRPAEKRMCLVCWKEVEDEEHYLMKCIRYKKEREETQERIIKGYKVRKKEIWGKRGKEKREGGREEWRKERRRWNTKEGKLRIMLGGSQWKRINQIVANYGRRIGAKRRRELKEWANDNWWSRGWY